MNIVKCNIVLKRRMVKHTHTHYFYTYTMQWFGEHCVQSQTHPKVVRLFLLLCETVDVPPPSPTVSGHSPYCSHSQSVQAPLSQVWSICNHLTSARISTRLNNLIFIDVKMFYILNLKTTCRMDATKCKVAIRQKLYFKIIK